MFGRRRQTRDNFPLYRFPVLLLAFLVALFAVAQIFLVRHIVTDGPDWENAPAAASPRYTASALIDPFAAAAVPEKAETLRAVIPRTAATAGVFSPFGPGYEVELLGEFAAYAKKRIRWRLVESDAEAAALIASGKADIAAGFSGYVPQDSRTEIAGGREYTIHNAGAALEEVLAEASIRRTLKTALRAMPGNASPKQTRASAQWLEPHEQAIPGTVNAYGMRLQRSPYPGARLTGYTPEPLATERDDYTYAPPPKTYRWIWRTDDRRLGDTVASFWEKQEKAGAFAELYEKYFGFLAHPAANTSQAAALSRSVLNRMSPFRRTIADAARQYSIPPLLLTALIYQESNFNPEAQSPTGPLGLMQFTRATAREFSVDPLNPEASIYAGALYLKTLWDGLADLDLDEWNRWSFTLASYNQGPASLRAAVRISKSRGGSGKTWREVKKAYPLVATESSITTCRGDEAVDYVERIRYYYYIMHGGTSHKERNTLAAMRNRK